MGLLILLVVAAAIVGADRLITGAREAKKRTLVEDARHSYGSGSFDAAIRDLESAIDLDPSDREAQLLLAQAYEASGDLVKAEAAYRRSLEIDPEQPQALYNLAVIHQSQAKTTEAIAELERAVQQNGAFVAARIKLAELYVAQGDKAAAKEQYETVIEMKPYGTDIEAIEARLEELE